MKKVWFFAMAVLAWVFLSSISFGANYGGGSGTAADPYQIADANDLNAIGLHPEDWDKCFILTDDIDMSGLTGSQYNIIGNETTHFTGTFDGSGHIIHNLTHTSNTMIGYVGLFGYASYNVTIKNLGLENINLSARGNYTGGLVGYQEGGTITGCYTTGSFVSNPIYASYLASYSGGLVGYQSYGTIIHCYSTTSAAMTPPSSYYSFAGGLVGCQHNGIIMTCYSTGAVTINSTGIKHIGGLSGYGGNVINSFWDIQTSDLNTSAGGNGRTTAQLKQSANYIGWNTPTQTCWTIHEGVDYPRLAWQDQPGTALAAQTLGDFVSGAGTPSDPYRIRTPQQLNVIGLFADQWDKVFRLENDIDAGVFSGTEFNRISVNNSKAFNGTFDGNGHVIHNLTYVTTAVVNYVGLFGSISIDSVIKNLGIENVNFSTGGQHAGALAGLQNFGTITGCCSIGSVTSYSPYAYAGGLVGELNSGTITGCCSAGTVHAYSSRDFHAYAGGLAGWQVYGVIRDCYSMSSVTATSTSPYDCSYAGGLVGYQENTSNTKIEKCYSTGFVSAVGSYADKGGLLGYKDGTKATVAACFWDTETSGLNTSAGGEPKTTAQKQTLSTFTSAEWDFTNETTNGANDIWRMCGDGVDYPRLNWESMDGDFQCPDGVIIEDLDYFVGRWLMEDCTLDNNYCGGADGDISGIVNLADWVLLAEHWMEM